MPRISFPFPVAGLHKGFGLPTQPELTSPDLLNVRPTDASESRLRGGQRPGLKLFMSWAAAQELPVIVLGQLTITT